MQLLKLAQADIPTILAFDKKHAPHPPLYHKGTISELNSFFDNKSAVCYAIYENQTMIGHVSYMEDTENIYYLDALVMHPRYRKKGVAGNVFDKIKEEIKKKGGKEIFLTVSPLNKTAISFYEKHRFRIYDSKKNVYGPGSDRFYMKLKL